MKRTGKEMMWQSIERGLNYFGTFISSCLSTIFDNLYDLGELYLHNTDITDNTGENRRLRPNCRLYSGPGTPGVAGM